MAYGFVVIPSQNEVYIFIYRGRGIMRSFFSGLCSRLGENLFKPAKKYLSTPVGKITIFNTILFSLWKAKGPSENVLVEHFSFERQNIQKHRLYTALTYAFSHMSILHFGINMLALNFLGNKIQRKYGAKYVWLLYLAGAVAGSVAMNYMMPYDIIPMPKVGADPCIASFVGFMATLNPRLTVFHLIVPFKLWFLVLLGFGLIMVSDSSRKNLGGLAMGVGLGLVRRTLLL